MRGLLQPRMRRFEPALHPESRSAGENLCSLATSLIVSPPIKGDAFKQDGSWGAEMGVNFNTTHEMVVMAQRNLSHDEWDYINGAAESETSLRRNRLALDCLAFRPRILRNVKNVDTSTTLLGSPLRMPVVLAPIGGL